MPQLAPFNSPPKGLFWSAPIELDRVSNVKDPLALDSLAQGVGSWLFRSFTTDTTEAQYYAVVLYGLHLVDRAIREYRYPEDYETRANLFMRWERFWVLATIEFADKELGGCEETPNGILGVTRARIAWRGGAGLDEFQLLDDEKGGAFNYINSLGKLDLVDSDSLRVQPSAQTAQEIIDSFWFEPGNRNSISRYEKYALAALDPDWNKVAKSHGDLTLADLGKRSHLHSLSDNGRSEQRDRLWKALFVDTGDPTSSLAKMIVKAKGVMCSKKTLKEISKGQWGKLSPDSANKVLIALNFGKVYPILLDRFNHAYGHVHGCGRIADFDDVAKIAFPENETKKLRRACKDLLNTPKSEERFGNLGHGPRFIKLLSDLMKSSEDHESLQHLLQFHQDVKDVAWLCGEQGRDRRRVVMWVDNYYRHNKEAKFPHIRLYVVDKLLKDLGRIK